jgi:hypothetical protein
MERDGLLVESPPPEATGQDAGSRWRFYEITGLGREVLDLEVARLESDLDLVRSRIPSTQARQTS